MQGLQPTDSVLTEDVSDFVRNCLDGSPKKQRHTAKPIYDRLVEEMSFAGNETTVRHLASYLREKI